MSGLATAPTTSAKSSCAIDSRSIVDSRSDVKSVDARSALEAKPVVDARSALDAKPVVDSSAARDMSLVDSIASVGSPMSERAIFEAAIASTSGVDSKSLVGSIPALAKTSWLRRLASGWCADDSTEELDAVAPAVPKSSWFVCWRARRR